jgi:hypothetical protein
MEAIPLPTLWATTRPVTGTLYHSLRYSNSTLCLSTTPGSVEAKWNLFLTLEWNGGFGPIHVSAACSNGKRIPGSEEVWGCDTSNAKPSLYLGKVKPFIQFISRHIIVYNMPTHTSDCSTYVLWSWVEGFLSACSCAGTLYHKTKLVWIRQIYAFLKIMSHISRVYSSVKWHPIGSCLYCWQMARHIISAW